MAGDTTKKEPKSIEMKENKPKNKISMIKDNDDGLFSWKICGKTAKNIRRHIRLNFNGFNTYQCNQCKQVCNNKSSLNLHILNMHKEQAYNCTYCDHIFSRPSKFKVHQRIHTGERPYKCSQCDRSFAQSGNCNAHQSTHNIKLVVCWPKI